MRSAMRSAGVDPEGTAVIKLTISRLPPSNFRRHSACLRRRKPAALPQNLQAPTVILPAQYNHRENSGVRIREEQGLTPRKAALWQGDAAAEVAARREDHQS